jgi:hypothetical protein
MFGAEAVMIRKQFFIREDQRAALKTVASRDGVAEAELVREGIDLVLARKRAAEDDGWKEGFRQIRGMWKDRDDIDELFAERRKRRVERRKRMNALMSKWRA